MIYSNKFIAWLKEEHNINYDNESNKFHYCKECQLKDYTVQGLYFYFSQFIVKVGDF